MFNNEIEKLKTLKEHLDQWLKQNSETQRIVPKVQEIRDNIAWTIDAATDQPDEAREIPFPNLQDAIDAQSQFIQDSLPDMPRFDTSLFYSGSAVNTTISAAMYGYVSRVGDIPTDDAREYSLFHSAKYQQLQQTYGRVDDIRSLLSTVTDSMTLKRLDSALNTFSAWKSGAASRTSAANEIRNLLHGIKGDLENIAFGKTHANKTWSGMCAKVAKGGLNSREYIELLKQERVHSDLISRLSKVSKDMEGGSLTNLEVIWTETLDHIYVILNFIGLRVSHDI